MTNNIEKSLHEELLFILEELLKTIQQLQKVSNDILLTQNESEVKEWIVFLQCHIDKDELKTLEDEIADRFIFKFDFATTGSELDTKRTQLMKNYMVKSNYYLKS